MKFIKSIKSSIYNPAFYNGIFNKPFSFSLKYFLSLAILMSFLNVVFLSFSLIPATSEFLTELGPKILSYYPDELEITVKNGQVSTNVQEPYSIKMPLELKENNQVSEQKISGFDTSLENLIIIDTKSPLTVENFVNYKTVFLLGPDSVAYYNENNIATVQSIGNTVSDTITEAEISALLNKIMPWLKILPPVIVIILFVGLFIGITFNLILLLLGALLIWIVTKIKNIDKGYLKAYQIGLHAMTLSIILDYTVFQIYPKLEFPLLSILIMLVVVWFNLQSASAVNSTPEKQSKPPVVA